MQYYAVLPGNLNLIVSILGLNASHSKKLSVHKVTFNSGTQHLSLNMLSAMAQVV